MFWIWIPVSIVSLLHLDQQLSPQGSDLPKPFPRSILAHSTTVPSYNMALIINRIKLINPSYFTIVCPHPGWLCYYCNVSCICYPMPFIHLCFIVFYYALLFLSLYFMYWCIDLFSSTAARVFNKLTYLLTYLHVLLLVRNYCNGCEICNCDCAGFLRYMLFVSVICMEFTRQNIVSYLRNIPIQRRRSHSGKTRCCYNRELCTRYNNF